MVPEPPTELIDIVNKLGDMAIGEVPGLGTANDVFGLTDQVADGVKSYLTGDNPDGDLNIYVGRVDKLGENGIAAALQAAVDRHPGVNVLSFPDARRAYDDGVLIANRDLENN